MDSISLYERALSKAVGDRGGTVLGRTKSGKPIYESHHASYAGFSRRDHLEALDAHQKKAGTAIRKLRNVRRQGGDSEDAEAHENVVIHHVEMAQHHADAARRSAA